MKSFILTNLKRVSDDSAIADTSLVVSEAINATNEYMLFDDGFIRREKADRNEPVKITVFDKCGFIIGSFTRTAAIDEGTTCVWPIEETPDKELSIKLLKSITNPDYAKQFYRELLSLGFSGKYAYLRGNASMTGCGTLKNILKAAKEFLAGADVHDNVCEVAYAFALQSGWFGQQPDPIKAVGYLESAIDNGNPVAKARLVELYLNNPSITNNISKALQLNDRLLVSKTEIYSSDIEKTFATVYVNADNKHFDPHKALDLYIRNGMEVDNKALAIIIIDRIAVAPEELQAHYDKQAYEYITQKSQNEFDGRCGESLKKALIARCERLGIGCQQNLKRFLEYGIPHDPSRLGPLFKEADNQTQQAMLREYMENTLGKIEISKVSLVNDPGTKSSYYAYGGLLKYIGYLREFVRLGYSPAEIEVKSLSAFLNSISVEFQQEYQEFVARQQAEEQELRRKEQLWYEEQQLEKRKKEAEEKAQREKERAERERQIEEERKELSKTHKDVWFTFEYVYRSSDFNDNPEIISGFESEWILNEVYLALVTGGENAIKSYINSKFLYRNTSIISARMGSSN